MRILQITNKSPYPPKDGGSIACFNFTRGFSQLNHDITVLSMNTEKHHIDYQSIPKKTIRKIQFRFVDVPAKISTIPALLNLLFSVKPYNASRFISNRFRKALIQLLQEKQFDVIQLEGLYLCPYITTIRKYSKALIAYRAHNIEHEIWKRTCAMSKGAKKFYLSNLSKRLQRFETAFLNQYDVLIPISCRDADMLNKLGNTKPVFVSQTGIDTAKVQPDYSNVEYPSLFHIGALDWSPNQEGLLWFLDNCWEELNRQYSDLKFYIAGRNAPDWLIEKFNRSNVVYEGEVDDAHQFINSKAIMVVPLLSGSGMRIKIIEGMALGKAIVSTNIGAEGIAIENEKHLFLADKPKTFIEAIKTLVDNKNLHKKVGLDAAKFIQDKFDNVVICQSLIDFYQEQIP